MNSEITARAFATSANMGVMFDCGAITIKELYCDISFKELNSGYKISIEGYGKDYIPTDKHNLAYMAITEYLKYTNSTLKGFSLHINNKIPFYGGLGSSAASIIATLKAVNEYFNNKISSSHLLEIALKIEPHGDNLLACLLGGFTLFNPDSPIKINVPNNLVAVLSIPNYRISTKAARGILPKTYSITTSIKALQNSSLLTYAMINSDFDVLKKVLQQDVIHEPFRYKLNPSLKDIRNFANSHNALGTTISGSGSTIISFVKLENQETLYNALTTKFSNHTIIKVSFINHGVILL